MRALVIALGLGAILSASACKSIPDSRTYANTDAGTGGSGGTGGAGSGGSSGGGSGGACSPSSCSPQTVPGAGSLLSCCATSGGTGCGLDMSSSPLNFPGLCEALGQVGQPGVPGCLDQVVGGLNRTGCCRLDGTCGVQMGPLGCVATSDVGLGTAAACTTTCSTTAGAPCRSDNDCCDTTPTQTGAACAYFTGSGACTSYCTTNAECASGCCKLGTADTLSSYTSLGKGMCAPDATACSAGCRQADEVCDSSADCCGGSVCVAQFEGGPRLCRPACGSSAGADGGVPCGPGEICIQDSGPLGTLDSACARPEVGLCTDTCATARNGLCEDGSLPGGAQTCAYGSDCTDCQGPHIGGNAVCSDSCSNARNGICEDSGPNAGSSACSWGTDCQDCGPRLTICTNTCANANNGVCNYDDATCALGTDCADCGHYYGGRGQRRCDGSTGTICTGSKTIAQSHGSNGTCECADCGWDATDCAYAFGQFCDGSQGACCGPAGPSGDTCGIAADGVCDCGGWCSWETDCAYSRTTVAPLMKCDNLAVAGCGYPYDPANMLSVSYVGNNICDCQGACSWETEPACATLGYICQDSCALAGDTICEDGGPNSTGSGCAYGTDCRDCGAEPGISP